MTVPHPGEAAHTKGLPIVATLGALGVVYGDIGTSPLYALKEAAKPAAHGGPLIPESTLGVVSLIFWALILIISIKYALLIMRADNRGEGGIVAMLALLHARNAQPGTWRAHLLVVGLVGAALLYGDGAITPAISVLSAIEGLKVDAPSLAPAVVPVTIVILVGLFMMQKQGAGFIGRIFGPVMLAWFVVLAALGIHGIVKAPAVLAALSPLYAVEFLTHQNFHVSFAILGAAFLAVTGGEAMYADMGHFGRMPIRLAWFAVALPALVLNYFGQAALLIVDPSAIDNPFFQLAPDWVHYPLLAFVVAFLMLTWRAGVRLVENARGALRQPEEDLIETAVNRCHARLSGTAVFLASSPKGVPLALTQFVKHNHVLHQRVVLVTVLIEESPRITDEDRAEIIEVIPGITRVILHYGFMQYPTIYEGLILACKQGKLPGIDLTDITYYIGRETIIPREDIPGMWVWREALFAFLQRNAERSAAFFGVPTKQVVEFGTEIEI